MKKLLILLLAFCLLISFVACGDKEEMVDESEITVNGDGENDLTDTGGDTHETESNLTESDSNGEASLTESESDGIGEESGSADSETVTADDGDFEDEEEEDQTVPDRWTNNH